MSAVIGADSVTSHWEEWGGWRVGDNVQGWGLGLGEKESLLKHRSGWASETKLPLATMCQDMSASCLPLAGLRPSLAISSLCFPPSAWLQRRFGPRTHSEQAPGESQAVALRLRE